MNASSNWHYRSVAAGAEHRSVSGRVGRYRSGQRQWSGGRYLPGHAQLADLSFEGKPDPQWIELAPGSGQGLQLPTLSRVTQ
jgi:hypothetical protein